MTLSCFHGVSLGNKGDPDWSSNGMTCGSCHSVAFGNDGELDCSTKVVSPASVHDVSLVNEDECFSNWSTEGEMPFRLRLRCVWSRRKFRHPVVCFRRRLRALANQFFTYSKHNKDSGKFSYVTTMSICVHTPPKL